MYGCMALLLFVMEMWLPGVKTILTLGVIYRFIMPTIPGQRNVDGCIGVSENVVSYPMGI